MIRPNHKSISRKSSLKIAFSLFVLFFSMAQTVWAGWDSSASGVLRTYPLSGGLDIDLGYGQPLWGSVSADSKSKSPWYGYVRPLLTYSTTGNYNAAMGQIQIFPISFIGFRGGYQKINNQKDYAAYDCVTYQCMGLFDKKFTSAQMALGYGPIFAFGEVKREEISSDKEDQSFIEATSGLPAQALKDEVTTQRGVLGYQISEHWSSFIFSSYSDMKNLKGCSRMVTFNIKYSESKYDLFIGGGEFESNIKPKGFTLFSGINIKIQPSISLM